MRDFLKKYSVIALALGGVFLPSAAHAGMTMGGIFLTTVNSISSMSYLFSYFSYTTGILMVVVAIFRLKDHVDNPAQTPLSTSVKRFIVGGMFLALPFMAVVVRNTIYGGENGDDAIRGSPGSVLDPFATDGSGNLLLNPDGLDGMVVMFMANIGGPFQILLSAFVYFLAIGLLLVGINRLTKRMDEGPRGPAGMGTIMTFVTAGVLFAWADVAGVLTNSIFDPMATGGDSGQAATDMLIDPMNYLGLSDQAGYQISQVIKGVMLFVALVGMIAFVRGWLVLRAFADGQQGASLAQGLTFLVGGSLAINLGDLVNALQTTVGVQGITFF